MSADAKTNGALDLALVRAEWPPTRDGSLYFNTGSCGRKPRSVLATIQEGWETLNDNPTIWTFLSPEPAEGARAAASELFGVPGSSLLLTQNSTNGLQIVMQSLLLNPGDELVTTTHEHGSLRTIAQYLEETRGIVIRRHQVEPLDGSDALCDGLLSLVNQRTRLVAVSEIDCGSGWRPNLSKLAERLRALGIPVLADGAHSAGQGRVNPSMYPFWVSCGHKWLCGPNGTGFLYVAPEWIERLRPLNLGDHYYHEMEHPLQRLEFPGTWDVVRLMGLKTAIELNARMGQQAVADRSAQLVRYLRTRIAEISGAQIRTPDVPSETTALLMVTWPSEHVPVPNIKEYLWERHQIWCQSDFFYGQEGHGLRLSCHVSLTESDVDRLITALQQLFPAR